MRMLLCEGCWVILAFLFLEATFIAYHNHPRMSAQVRFCVTHKTVHEGNSCLCNRVAQTFANNNKQ